MYSWRDKGFAPACDKCPVIETCDCGEAGARCKIVEEIRDEVIANIGTQPHIKPLVHGGLIARLATTRAKLWWCDLYLSIHGMMQLTGADDDGAGRLDVQPLVREQTTLERQELALAQELGLTPMAEAKLRLDNSEAAGFDMAAALAKVHREREERLPTPAPLPQRGGDVLRASCVRYG
jgi:hypothetical protein